MKRSKVIIAYIFSAAILGAVWIGGVYFNKARGHAKTVSVVGKAERDFDSDLIVWHISYSVINTDMKSGYSELRNINKTVHDYLTQKGIATTEADFQAIDSDKETEYFYDKAAERSFYKFVGWRLRQTVVIESSNVDEVEKLSRELPEILLDKGIQLDQNYLNYYYTKLSDLKIEMLADATTDARNRAETITKSAGSHLGGLQTANMGVFQITAPNSSDEDYSWGGTFNTTSRRKRASINMRLTYYVK